ncbi:hypothetical protein [Kitasatospora sp. NPDC001175]|uniref:hypothetical protein n=1 Tax=Kitasatospora sp. NPDC001175 TaxID=3157103 RepID=UPI003D00C282
MRDLESLITTLRDTFNKHARELELWTPAIPTGADPQTLDLDTPPGVAALLSLSDGPYLDHSTQIYSSGDLSWQQVADNLVDAELPDGSTLTDASRFFCFGQACQNPLLVDVTDGSVWRVPDDGVVWYTGCRLERIADSVEEFFMDWVASPKYQDLAGLDPDELESSDWYRLLRLSGLAPLS